MCLIRKLIKAFTDTQDNNKKDNITPLGERFYEILNSELSEMPNDLD